MNWYVKIIRITNGLLVKYCDEEATSNYSYIIPDNAKDENYLENMDDMLSDVVEFLGFCHSKYNKKKLTIKVEDNDGE